MTSEGMLGATTSHEIQIAKVEFKKKHYVQIQTPKNLNVESLKLILEVNNSKQTEMKSSCKLKAVATLG